MELPNEEAPVPGQKRDEGSALMALDRTRANIASNAVARNALNFLRSFGRRQPTLSFLDHDNGRFFTKRYETVRKAAWGASWWNERGRSVYFVGNSHLMEKVSKPSRDDIELCVGVWIDIDDVGRDPDVVWTLTHRLDWPPAYVAFTGGGLQAHWRFDVPTADVFDCEAINLWLIDQFADLSPDKCFTAEHLWRLPGTRNRKPGRDSAVVEVVQADWAARLPLAEAGRRQPPASVSGGPVSFDHEWVTMDVARDCLSDSAFALLNTRPGRCPSRSEHEFAFIGAVLGERDPVRQADIDLVAACLLATPADENSVSHRAHFLPSGAARRDPAAHVARQIRSWLAKNGRTVDESC